MRAILENTGDLVSYSTPDLRLLFMNAAGRRLLGWTSDEDLSARPIDTLHPAWATAIIRDQGIPTTLTTGRWQGETAILRRDGSEIPVSQIITAHRGPDGEVQYISTVMRDISDRKRAEGLLRRSESRFRAIIERSGDVFSLLDERGTTLYDSPSVRRWFGYDEYEHLGTSAFELVHPDDRPGAMAALAGLARRPDESVTHELRFRHKDGSWRWIEINATNLLGNPDVKAVVLAYRDVTERNRAQTALRESEAKFRAIFESSNDAVILLDTMGIFDVNDATLRMLGGPTREAILGRHPADFSPPRQPGGEDSMSLAQEHIAAALQRGPRRFEWMHRRADGTEFPADVLLSPVELEGRTVLQGVIRDISDRKRAEEALRASERRFRAIIEQSGDVYALVDDRGRLVYNSPSVKRLFGYDERENVSTNAFERVHPDERARTAAAFQDLVRRPGESVTHETRYRHKDGSWRWIEMVATNLLENPDVKAVVLVYRDVTERKREQEALRESEKRFHTLFEFSPDACYLADANGVFVDGNRAAERLSGYERRDLIGKQMFGSGLLLPTDVGRAIESTGRISRGLPTGPNDYTLLRKDGTRRLIEVQSIPVDLGGQRLSLGIARDVTDRKRAEALVQAQRDLGMALAATSSLEVGLRRCLDAALAISGVNGGGIYLLDRTGRDLVLAVHQGLSDGFVRLVERYKAGSPKFEFVMAGRTLRVLIGDRPGVYGVDEAAALHEQGLKTGLVIPILQQDRVIACLNVVSRDADAFPDETTHALEAIATQIGNAISRLEAEQALRLNESRLNSLLLLSQTASELDEREIIAVALEGAVRLTGSRIGYFHMVHEDQETIEFHSWSRDALKACSTVFDRHAPLSAAGVWADSVRTRQPVVHNDYASLPGRRGLPQGHSPVARHMSVPVIDGGLVRAVLGVGNKGSDYLQDDVRQLQLMANDVWKLLRSKRADEALRRESAFRDTIITRASEGLCVFQATPGSPSLVFTVWNERMTEITGYTMESINRLGWFASLYPDPATRQRAIDRLDRMRKGEDLIGEEAAITCADGTMRTVRISTSFLPAGNGGGPPILALIQDITGQKDMERRIHEVAQAERERVQRDLHDTVCQHLSGIAFLAAAVKEDLRVNPAEAVVGVTKIDALGRKALEQAKHVARFLQPLPDDPDALVRSLGELADYLQTIYAITCRVARGKPVVIRDGEVSTQLALIAREAALNAVKHAKPTTIRLSLSRRGTTVTLRVADDGHGMPPHAGASGGLGLQTMRNRADLIGARLAIRPNRKCGTVVECTWTDRA